MAWLIVIAIVLLILAFPVGVDAQYASGNSFLKLKLGFFRRTLLPSSQKKDKKKKKKKTTEKPSKPGEEDQKKEKKKPGLTLDDILTLAEIALDALHRFFFHLSVDLLVVHWCAGASDPYGAVQQYGRVNALLGITEAKLRNALKIRESDIRTALDLGAERPEIVARLVLSIQIWEILLIGVCAGVPALRWMINKKRMERAAAAAG